MGWGDIGNFNLDGKLYDVQYGKGFTNQESNQIKNLKYINKLHTDLSKLEHEYSWKKFNKLGKEEQEMLKGFYGVDNEYMSAPTTGWDSLRTGIGAVLSNVNPFAWAGKAIEEYSQLVNTVPNAIMDATVNDANIWDWDTWSNAYNNGEAMYDNARDAELEAKYGKERAFIAKKALEGLTPGEIMAARGELTEGFVKQFESFLNEEEKWNDGILEDYRQAKLSAGRVIARNLLGERSGKGDVDDESFTFLSGLTDAAVTILTDPLTYLTAGASSGVRIFGKALSQTAKAADAFKAGGVAGAFRVKGVAKYWDDYGSTLKELSEARSAKNFAKQEEIVQKIKNNFFEHGRSEDVELLVKNKVFDAKSAEKFFEEGVNVTKLITGRTADMTYYRNSIAVAKRRRIVGAAMRNKWSQYASSGITDSGKFNTLLEETADALRKGGEEIDVLTGKVELPGKKLEAQFKGFKKLQYKIGKALSLAPADNQIFFSGDNVGETLDEVVALASQIMPKDFAIAYGQMFLKLTPEERLVQLRGLYRGSMESMGLDKTLGGREFIDTILREKFGAFGKGMSFSDNLVARDGWELGEDSIKANGALHSGQTTGSIGPINWQAVTVEAAQAAFETGGRSKAGRHSALATIGGAMNGKLSNQMGSVWTFFTLAPRLGIRSAIDESFFFLLTAPRQALLKNIPGRNTAKMAGRAMTAYTGSDSAIGVVSSWGRRKLVPQRIKDKYRTVDPVNAIPYKERHTMWLDIVGDVANQGKSGEELAALYADALGLHAVSMYKKLGIEASQDVYDALAIGLSDIGSAASAAIRATGASGIIDDSVRIQLNNPSMLTKIHQDLKVELGDFYTVSGRDLDDFQKAVVQFNGFILRFNGSKAGKVNLGRMFLKHNGLKTKQDLENAIADTIKSMSAKDKKIFMSQRGSTVSLRNQLGKDGSKLTEDQIIAEQLKAAFADMNMVFHGSANGFNEALFAKLTENSKILKYDDAYEKIIRGFDFENYQPLVADNLFKDEISTNIVKMEGFDGSAVGWYSQWGNQMWEAMDRTVTGLMRQPAVTSYYLATRQKFRPLEAEYAEKLYRGSDAFGLQNAPKTLSEALESSTPAIVDAAEFAQIAARRAYAEISMKHSVQNVLKYVDNPHIRTNFASSIRSVNRFYRATEDFWRRVYRLKDVSSQAFYRARMLHSGLSGTGILEQDQNGEEYFVIPIDNILYYGLDMPIRAITGNTGFQQPLFQNMTVKMSAVNPSFQEDSGIPYLSGPTAALSVLTLKAIAGNFGPTGEKFSENVDNFLLGDLGDNLDLQKALVPAMISKLWTALDASEKSQANHSAVLSAIAYNQAAVGENKVIHPGQLPNATPRERADYLNQIRISAHNLVALRSVLGMISPFSVSTEEMVNIPEYIRDSGVVNIRAEYFEILNTVMEKYGSDVSDPFELAAALFVGDNPDKLVYTVSREDKNVKAIIERTKQTQNWLFDNKQFTDAYGQAAYFFAPLGGTVNLGMYQWMKSAGLYEDVEVEEYLTRAQTAADKQKYFEIGRRLDAELSTTAGYEERSTFIKRAEADRAALKMSNPYLEEALSGSDGFGVSDEEDIVKNLSSILEDSSAPLSLETREKLSTALTIFNRGYRYITGGSTDVYAEASLWKRTMRDNVLADLDEISGGDRVLSQLVRAVFKPILKFYSRDSASASAFMGPLG